MVDARMVARVSAPEPQQPAHLATKNYVDTTVDTTVGTAVSALVAGLLEDSVRYGDMLSSTRRDRASNQSTLDNGFWTFSSVTAPRSFTATKVRFFVAAAGVATLTPVVGLGIYDNGTRVATAPVTSATFTAAGVKELDLSAPVTVVTGHRYTWLSYIAPNSYSSPAGVAFTTAYRVELVHPTPALTFSGYKAAAVAPPASITTGDGTWTAHSATAWWALL